MAEPHGSTLLAERLAAVLPEGYKFGVHHLSTPPFRTDALCSALPNTRPDRTYCENHFLALSIDTDHPTQPSSSASSSSRNLTTALAATAATDAHPATDAHSPAGPATGSSVTSTSSTQVLVLALEIFIFTTAYSTIFFVSKADSTGYLHLLNLPNGTPSPIREVSAAFISYLVEHRRRDNIQSVVSLFARAQAQYLFPGSVENSGKHVLDDRGLVKWWCKVLNPLLESRDLQAPLFSNNKKKPAWGRIAGYLVIPGLDAYESRAFLPRTASAARNWTLGHPLEKISHFTREYDWVPARCLIPRYPDDPKSRFRDELDGEASHWTEYREKGSWKSVKTLEQFWEMMAFRQECSGGHMTGFVWVVFDPPGMGLDAPPSPKPPLLTPSTSFDESQSQLSLSLPSTPPRRRTNPLSTTPQSSPLKLGSPSNASQRTPSRHSPTTARAGKRKKKALRGSIQVRQPRAKTHAKNYVPDIPMSTAYYSWPSEGRGARTVSEADYKQSVELLLRLDFANLGIAQRSTKRWISEVGGGMRWAWDVVGRKAVPAMSNAIPVGRAQVNNMTNLVRKKRPAGYELDEKLAAGQDNPSSTVRNPTAVNVLGLNLVRKKRKAPEREEDSGDAGQAMPLEAAASAAEPIDHADGQVNVLGTGLVRKKPKAL